MGIRINVSDKAVPRKKKKLDLGWYKLRINHVELRESQSEKNPGKPMYNFEVEITDDSEPFDENGASKFGGYVDWINACLWEGAEFTIVGILAALGREVEPGELDVPDITNPEDEDGGLDFFQGREIMARWAVRKKERIAAAKEKREPEPEWTSFRSCEEEETAETVDSMIPAVGRRRTLA